MRTLNDDDLDNASGGLGLQAFPQPVGSKPGQNNFHPMIPGPMTNPMVGLTPMPAPGVGAGAGTQVVVLSPQQPEQQSSTMHDIADVLHGTGEVVFAVRFLMDAMGPQQAPYASNPYTRGYAPGPYAPPYATSPYAHAPSALSNPYPYSTSALDPRGAQYPMTQQDLLRAQQQGLIPPNDPRGYAYDPRSYDPTRGYDPGRGLYGPAVQPTAFDPFAPASPKPI